VSSPCDSEDMRPTGDKPVLRRLVRFSDPRGIGKYLVMRRDGTVPAWSSFVLGARDRHAEVALRAYADSIETDPDCDPQLPDSIRHLAEVFAKERGELGDGDPTRGLHREDNPLVLLLMQQGKSG
jgi:hypothetical protein